MSIQKVTRPYVFDSTEVVDPTKVNLLFDTLYNAFNQTVAALSTSTSFLATKFYQVGLSASTASTTSTSYADLSSGSITFTPTGGPIFCSFATSLRVDSQYEFAYIILATDNAVIATTELVQQGDSNSSGRYLKGMALNYVAQPSAGTATTWKIQWKASAGFIELYRHSFSIIDLGKIDVAT